MTSVFLLQIIASFIIGGGFVALLTILAEKSSSRVAGIILSFPSTAIPGFFFLAWTQSPQEVATVIPSALIPIGLSVLFPVLYIFVSKILSGFTKKALPQIIFTLFISVSIWLLLAMPLAHHKMTHLLWGIVGYLVLTTVGFFVLSKSKTHKPKSHTYSFLQILGRAAFVGTIIATIVLIGEFINPYWGGVLSMFPGALSSSIIIMHWYYGHENLSPFFKKVPLGSLSTFVYALMVMLTFSKFGFIWGTLISFSASVLVSGLLSLLSTKKQL